MQLYITQHSISYELNMTKNYESYHHQIFHTSIIYSIKRDPKTKK